eukprot:Gb_41834 [translate_table: standard]
MSRGGDESYQRVCWREDATSLQKRMPKLATLLTLERVYWVNNRRILMLVHFDVRCQRMGSCHTGDGRQTSGGGSPLGVRWWLKVVILYIESSSVVLPWKMASNCEVVHPELLNNCTLKIGMLLTLEKVNITVGYPGGSVEDEGRDPNYFSLLVSGRDKGLGVGECWMT